MNNIVFTKELSGTEANKLVNQYLKKGWQLISAGQACVGTLENGQADYEIVYVIGANKAQYAKYQKEQSHTDIKQDINDFLANN